MPPVIDVVRVTKRFDRVTAVSDVSLRVEPGEVLALLGPNGAGKTTLVRMLVGIFRPDEGTVTHHLGGSPSPVPPKPLLGYLPEERGLYQDMPILATLVHFGALRGMARREAEEAARPWLDRLGLGARAGDAVKTLSKGNQQKVQFVAAVLHRPRLAILDEPFSGLDPLNQDLFVELIGELRAAGTTVLFSAHQMSLVERLADRVFLMSRGREVLHGTMAELRARWTTGDRLVIGVAGAPDAAFLDGHPAVEEVERAGDDEIRLRLRRGAPVGDLLRVVGERLEVTHVRSEAVTLHEIYVRTVGADASPVDQSVATEEVPA